VLPILATDPGPAYNGIIRKPDGAAAGVAKEITTVGKMRLLAEFWTFLKERKLWWMAPIIIILLLLGALIFLTEGSAIAPFIYPFM
jgi:hypothetical protein